MPSCYDPSLGRFTSADSELISGPGTQGLNRYAYALSDPLDMTDPTGNTLPETTAQYTVDAEAKAAVQAAEEIVLEAYLANLQWRLFLAGLTLTT